MPQYKCPNCGGEFDSWEMGFVTSGVQAPKCPFCGKKKGDYGPGMTTGL